jgi:hypothetical protein
MLIVPGMLTNVWFSAMCRFLQAFAARVGLAPHGELSGQIFPFP